MSDTSRAQDDVEVDLRAVFAAIVRRLPIVILIALLVGAGVFYLLGRVEPLYRAEATLLIETSEADLTREIDQALTATLLDQQGIQSQVELIRSREVAMAVIEDLNLTDVPEFDPALAEPSLLDQALGLLGLGDDETSLPIEEVVLAEFRARLSVGSIDQTRAIAISFNSTDPQLAADIVNAVAQEYITLQRDVRRDTTADATAWLEAEIEALRGRVVEAEAAVETFRAENNLFLAGQGNTNQTTLVAQQLSDLSDEISRVQSERADAQATAALIRANLEGDAPLSSLDVLNSPQIQRLREQQIAVRSQIAEAGTTLLPNHPRLRELNAQLTDIEQEIEAEARNILASLEGEVARADGYEAELASQFDELRETVTISNQAGVQLRDLERVAAAERQLLETYLGLAREAVSRQNTDYAPINVRIISRAAPPIESFYPKTIGMTAVAVIITMMLLVAFFLVRELASGRATRPVARPALPVVPGARPVDARIRWNDDSDVRRMMPADPRDRSALAQKIEESLASVAQKIRSLDARRIVITMAESDIDEGRPLAAVALARTLSRTGQRVLLVDLHSDDADRVAMGEEEQLPGFGDLFAGKASFAQVIFRDRSSPAHFIPRGQPIDATDTERFEALTEALDQTYDHVIYDLGDRSIALLGPSADAAVVVTEVEPSDPRTIRAYESVKGHSDAEILLLVTDPLPAEEEGAAA